MSHKRARRIELEAAREQASALVQSLADLASSNIVMAALYGSAARGDFDPEVSDLNLLLVLDDAGPVALQELGELLQAAKTEIRCAPFVLSREEVLRGADVFPVKFHEVRRCYRMLHGEDLLSPMRIEFKDLRLACEHELRSMTLKLRRTWLMERPRPTPLIWGLHLFVPQLLGVLRVVLEHDGLDPSASTDQFMAEVARRHDVEPGTLKAAVMARHKPDIAWAEVEKTYAVVLDVLGRASRQVDQWKQQTA